jgi:hypothetical protein
LKVCLVKAAATLLAVLVKMAGAMAVQQRRR